jgi:DNA-directed RNA polymerase subunit RPC12/RpoP
MEKMSEIEDLTNKNPQEIAVCSECDREVDHYYTFLSPTNKQRVVCWQCQMRDEKGFNAKRDFRRQARSGYIPR